MIWLLDSGTSSSVSTGLSRRPLAASDPPSDDPDELENWIDTSAGFFLEVTSPQSPLDPAPSLSIAFTLENKSPTTSQSDLSEPSHDFTIPRNAKAVRRDIKLSNIRQFLSTLTRPSGFDDDHYRQLI